MPRTTVVALILLALTAPLHALDDASRAKAEATIARGIDFVRTTQNPDGSWTPQPGPAVTGLVVTALLDHGTPLDDPALARGIDYIRSKVQPDGSIRDDPNAPLANYNTAICASALAKLRDRLNDPALADAPYPQVAAEVGQAVEFLKRLQWQRGMTDPTGEPITPDHPFYGGAGYGRHGRPDMSNTQFLVQAFHDAGVDPDDEAFQRAVAFLDKCRNVDANNTYSPGALSNDGGMIYSTSIDKDHIGVPESKANPQEMDEALKGQPVSGLRSYGSMTYAGFKSFLYADLDRDDPRVATALDWIKRNYTLEQNPGMPDPIELQGLYYYYLAHARALEAWGEPTLDTASEGEVDWAANLIEALAARQREDGSWVNERGPLDGGRPEPRHRLRPAGAPGRGTR